MKAMSVASRQVRCFANGIDYVCDGSREYIGLGGVYVRADDRRVAAVGLQGFWEKRRTPAVSTPESDSLFDLADRIYEARRNLVRSPSVTVANRSLWRSIESGKLSDTMENRVRLILTYYSRRI